MHIVEQYIWYEFYYVSLHPTHCLYASLSISYWDREYSNLFVQTILREFFNLLACHSLYQFINLSSCYSINLLILLIYQFALSQRSCQSTKTPYHLQVLVDIKTYGDYLQRRSKICYWFVNTFSINKKKNVIRILNTNGKTKNWPR